MIVVVVGQRLNSENMFSLRLNSTPIGVPIAEVVAYSKKFTVTVRSINARSAVSYSAYHRTTSEIFSENYFMYPLSKRAKKKERQRIQNTFPQYRRSIQYPIGPEQVRKSTLPVYNLGVNGLNEFYHDREEFGNNDIVVGVFKWCT